MLRAPRRYRIFLIFSLIFGLAFLQFVRSRDWSSESTQPLKKVPDVNIPPPNRNGDSSSSHGFASDSSNSRIEAPRPNKKPPVNNNEPPTVHTQTNPVKSPIDEKPKPDKATPVQPTIDTEEADKSKVGVPDKGTIPTSKHSEFGASGQEVEPLTSNLQRPHWKKLPEHFPVAASDLIKLPSGKPKTLPKLQAVVKDESSTDALKRTQRLSAIKSEFLHAWKGYKENALGHDEVRPVTGGFRDPFAGWGATLVDALDTLWIMDLKDEFVAAVDEVKNIDFTTSFRKDIPLFETVIRYLGGLIGAYDISGGNYPVLLDKAVELGEILIGAFDTPNRMPVTYYYWAPDYVSQPHRAGTRVVMAELGSLSVEFTRLAQLTKDDKYYDAIARITDALEDAQKNTRLPGMWPLLVDASGCKKPSSISSHLPSLKEKADSELVKNNIPNQANPTPSALQTLKNTEKRDSDTNSGLEVDAEPADYGTESNLATSPSPFPKKQCEQQGLASPPYSHSDRFGLGGQSDSTYEYLPKEYMLLGGLNEQYRSLYETSMKTVRDTLLFRPMIKGDRDIRFTATVEVSDQNEVDSEERDIKYTYEGTHLTCFAGGMFAVGAKLFGLEGDMDIASKLTDGCVWAYESTATGIMPEGFEVLPCENPLSCSWNETRYLDVMDPYENNRIQQAENWYQLQVKEAKEAYDESRREKHNIVGPVRTPATQRTESRNNEGTTASEIGNRDSISDEYDEHAHLAASKTVAEKADAANAGVRIDYSKYDLPPKPTVLSHEEYVANMIKEERIPHGFTKIQSRSYILRPEAIESVFIMFRLTGDEYWREKGWKMFEAIVRHCRTDIADSAITDVTSSAPRLADSMESFWLAETLKYFYLLYSDPSVVSLDEYILNTEAHPMKRPIS